MEKVTSWKPNNSGQVISQILYIDDAIQSKIIKRTIEVVFSTIIQGGVTKLWHVGPQE